MQITLSTLAKRAVEAALKSNWDLAIEVNQQIVDKNPTDMDARMRLGRAYVQTKQPDKAKKIFKDILKEDPINPVAIKNLEIVNKGRIDHKMPIKIDTRSLLKEPGTTTETTLTIVVKGITSNDFAPSENLLFRIKKKSIDVYKMRKDADLLIGTLENVDIVQKLNIANDKGAEINAAYIRGKDKDIVLTIKSSEPVFKAERQDIRPYIKKGGLDEPELETEEVEEVIEE